MPYWFDQDLKEKLAAWGNGVSSIICCFIFHITFPLLPILIDYVSTGEVKQDSLFISVAGYSIALAISSRWLWFFCSGVFVSILYSILYGLSKTNQEIDKAHYTIYVIIALIGCHMVERFYRHMMLKAPFFEFKN